MKTQIATETHVANHNSYVITTNEGTEKGLFFRSPIQKVTFDAYYDRPRFSAWKYLDQIKNPIKRIYEYLLGNRRIVKNINKWPEDWNWGGFNANILCSPIYFKREYRTLSVSSTDPNTNIQSIESYGYESEFNFCAGDCKLEKTIITLKTGKRLKFKKTEQYHFTYKHIIERILDDGLSTKDIR